MDAEVILVSIDIPISMKQQEFSMDGCGIYFSFYWYPNDE